MNDEHSFSHLILYRLNSRVCRLILCLKTLKLEAKAFEVLAGLPFNETVDFSKMGSIGFDSSIAQVKE